MSLNSKILMSLLAGAFAALVGWVIVDFNPWYTLPQSSGLVPFWENIKSQLMITVVFGALLGAALGAINGMYTASGAMTQRYVIWGILIGAAGGFLGLCVGQAFFGPINNLAGGYADALATRPLAFVLQVIARAIGWSLLGFFVGLVQGIPINSKRAMRHGAIGGLIGGLIGGTMFELTPYVLPPEMPHTGVISRGVGLTVTGAAIGFFIGLVETLLKQAWVRVLRGRNEGREYVITKPRTVLGRNELSDIGLFGDPGIAPAHAVIEMQAGRHVLHDGGAPVGTFVNGQRVQSAQLRDGDIIQIASMQLEFREKATASRLAPPPVDVAPKEIKIPSMEGICPYCGTKKDASGNCACSVGAAGSPTGVASHTVPSQADVGLGVQLPTPGPVAGSGVQLPTQQSVGQAPSAAPGVGPRLLGLSGPYAGRVFSLAGPVISIGREPGKSVELPMDTTVSRNHASIRNENGTFTVNDEGSSNGTTVNGMRITSRPLSPGDTVQFGSSAFRFEV